MGHAVKYICTLVLALMDTGEQNMSSYLTIPCVTVEGTAATKSLYFEPFTSLQTSFNSKFRSEDFKIQMLGFLY